jgi:hypothetical protein
MNVIAMHSTMEWPRNARASIEAAAARWGCDVRVFDFAYAPHPSWARLGLAKYLHAYERALVIDPDVFFTQDCPNFFEYVPATHVGMTPEIQGAEDGVGPYPWAGALGKWRHVVGRRVRVERHLQGGVCVYTPAVHGPIFEKMLGWWNMHGRLSFPPVYEQPLWHEVGERLFELPVRRLSRLMNRHTRRLSEMPESFVMHLTGGNKRERIDCTNWRSAATEPERIVDIASGGNTQLRERLREVMLTGLFHEEIAVVGAEMEPAAMVLAAVTTGRVSWQVADVSAARRRVATWGEARKDIGEFVHVSGLRAGGASATLMVRSDAAGLPVVEVREGTLTRSGAFEAQRSLRRWWRRVCEPTAAVGVVRCGVMRAMVK